MSENRSILLKSSMRFGLSMGIFWCLKYLLFIWGISSNFFGMLYMFITFFVPFLAYYFTWRYKIEIGGKLGFFHAWQFGILLYFFAALIVSLEHYVFYRYLAPPGFIASSVEQTLELLRNSNIDQATLEAFENINPTPIQMAIQGIFTNTFYGIVLSIPIAYLASKTRIPPLRNGDSTPTDQNEEN